MIDWSRIGSAGADPSAATEPAPLAGGPAGSFDAFVDRTRGAAERTSTGHESYSVLAATRVPLAGAPLGTFVAMPTGSGEAGQGILIRSVPLATILAGLPQGGRETDVTARIRQSPAASPIPSTFEFSPAASRQLSSLLAGGAAAYGRQSQDGWTLTPSLDIRDLSALGTSLASAGTYRDREESSLPEAGPKGQLTVGAQLQGRGMCLFFTPDPSGMAASLARTEAVTSAARTPSGLTLTIGIGRPASGPPSMTIGAPGSAKVSVPSTIARSLIALLDPSSPADARPIARPNPAG